MKTKIFAAIISVLFFSSYTFAEEVSVNSYTVKGQIKKLPEGEGLRRSALMIKHQEIPDYVGEDGKVVGMHAMTMPFDLSEGLELGNLQAGDCVEFKLDSYWKPKPKDQITQITKIECE